MKIKNCFLAVCFFLSISTVFISCEKKTDYSGVDLAFLQKLFSENIAYNLTGNPEYKKIPGDYFPDTLKQFFSRKIMTENGSYTVFELMNPEYMGVIESESFYSGCDDGQWVDKLVYQVNEMLMAMTLDELENNPLPPVDESSTAEEIERAIEESEKIEKRIIDTQNYLRILEFDEEVFIPVETDDLKIYIEKNGEQVTRSYYDGLFRICKKEYWEISNVENSKIIKSDTYEYKDTSLKAAKKIEQSENEKNIFYYDENGLAVKIERYVLYEGRAVLTSLSSWIYDSKKRVKEEVIKTNNFKDKSYQKILSKNTARTKYFYNNGDDISPDFEYYLNGELKMKNTYSSEKGKYTSQIYFDDMFAVKTYYENNLRKKDVYTVNGVVKRVENYD